MGPLQVKKRDDLFGDLRVAKPQTGNVQVQSAPSTLNVRVDPQQYSQAIANQTPVQNTNPLKGIGDFIGSLFSGTRNVLRSTDALTGVYDKKQKAIDDFEQTNKGKPGTFEAVRQMREALKNEYSFSGKQDPTTGKVDYNLSPAENLAKAAGVTLQTASELAPLPIGLAAKGANLATKVAKGAATGALASGVGSAGAQLTDKGQIDPGTTAIDAATGGVIAGAIPAIGAAVRGLVKPRPVVTAKMPTAVAQPVKVEVPAQTSKTAKPIAEKVQTSIDPSDPFNNRNILSRIRNEAGSLVDDDAKMIRLLRTVEKDTGRKGLVDQWMFDTGNVRASNSIANAKLKNSQDLSSALKGLSSKELKEFDLYTGARAELKNYEGLKTSQASDDLVQTVDSLAPKYEQRFTALNQYYKGLARDMYSGGLIDKPTLKRYLAADDYVRIQRDMEDLVGPRFGKSQARSLGTTTATQKRTGSERAILSPTQSVAKRAQQIELEIQRNRVAANTLKTLKDVGLARQVTKARHKNTISTLVNGKRQIFEVPGDIKQIMDNVSPYQLGIIARIVSTPTRLLRAGTTALSLPFTVTNYARDQASSAIFSKKIWATHNPQNVISSLGSAVKDFAGESRSPLWHKFEQFTGNQTIYDELRNAAKSKDILREIRLGKAGKFVNQVKHPIQTIEDLNSITERATRFQNFKGIYKDVLKSTGDEQEALKAAVLAARQNSVDFQRNSSFTRIANLFIPYFNASIQGSRNVVRSFRERPVATSMKSIGLVAIPSVAATLYNFSDPQRRKAYESINDFEKEDNFIIVGPDAKQRPDGTWEGIYKIPKPQGYRELTDPVRDVTEAFVKGEAPENVAKMLTDMLGGITGPFNTESPEKLVGGLIPQQAKPWIQLAANKDFYTGTQTVPEYMTAETDNPAERAFKGTSGTARLIAKQLGVSPIQVEKVVSDLAGSLGRVGLNTSDTVLANNGVIPKDQVGGRSIQTDFARRMFEASGTTLEENKTEGAKYFESIKKATGGLDKNELAAYNSLHPSKKNFLGDQIYEANSAYNPAARLDIYNRFPKVFEADKALDKRNRDAGKPGNPLFDLAKEQVKKVLERDNLPPGAKDPELSKLNSEQWYADYSAKKAEYFNKLNSEAKAAGKELGSQANPYPNTPSGLQRIMDTYNALPKGTGARSGWIKANPEAWQAMQGQFTAIDNWQNAQRGKRGLAATEGAVGEAAGFTPVTFSSNQSGGFQKPDPSKNPFKYAVSLNSGGSAARPKVSVKAATGGKPAVKRATKPKVTSRRSNV